MPFTVPSFPGRVFENVKEYSEAVHLKAQAEARLAAKKKEIGADLKPSPSILAGIVPADRGTIEARLASLELEIDKIKNHLPNKKKKLEVGTHLYGESKGQSYELEVNDVGFFCPQTQENYQSLSAAAFAVSGNRRSGWKFWKTNNGKTIGQATGRFVGDAQE